jgi:FtsH-binding integral membrane protein
MTSVGTAPSAPISREQAGSLLGQTMGLVQRLRRTEDLRDAPLLAASIFLDVLNVFLLFLQIFSNDD